MYVTIQVGYKLRRSMNILCLIGLLKLYTLFEDEPYANL